MSVWIPRKSILNAILNDIAIICHNTFAFPILLWNVDIREQRQSESAPEIYEGDAESDQETKVFWMK
jgi:hypothetical protein